MQNCEYYEDLISLHVDDMLNPEELLELLEHLDECISCHDYYLDLKKIKENVKNIEIEYPIDLKNSILEHIESNKVTQIVQVKQPKRLKAYLSLAACACFALLISSMTFFDNLNSSGTESAQDEAAAITTELTEESMPIAEPRSAAPQAFSLEMETKELEIPSVLFSEYAFVFTLKGSMEIPEISGDIMYSDDNVVVVSLENNISKAEEIISTLKKAGYEDMILDTTNYKINTELDYGVIAIFAE